MDLLDLHPPPLPGHPEPVKKKSRTQHQSPQKHMECQGMEETESNLAAYSLSFPPAASSAPFVTGSVSTTSASSSASATSNGVGLTLPRRKRVRTEEVVEELLNELTMDTEEGRETTTKYTFHATSANGDPSPSHRHPHACATSSSSVMPYLSPLAVSGVSSSPFGVVLPPSLDIDIDIDPPLSPSHSLALTGSSHCSAAYSCSHSVAAAADNSSHAMTTPTAQQNQTQHALQQTLSTTNTLHAFSSIPSPSSSAALTVTSPISLIDPSIHAHMQSHLAALGTSTLLPSITVDVVILLLLSHFDSSRLPACEPLTSATFTSLLRSIGCQSDAQLQEIIAKSIQRIYAPTTPNAHAAATMAANSCTGISIGITAPVSRPSPAFKSFYLQCFHIIKRILMPPFKRSIDIATGRFFLHVLLDRLYPSHIYPFLRFLDHRQSLAHELVARGGPFGGVGTSRAQCHPDSLLLLTFDHWSLLLDWCATIDPHTLAGYEVEGSWPVLFDEFVEWITNRGAARGAAGGGNGRPIDTNTHGIRFKQAQSNPLSLSAPPTPLSPPASYRSIAVSTSLVAPRAALSPLTGLNIRSLDDDDDDHNDNSDGVNDSLLNLRSIHPHTPFVSSLDAEQQSSTDGPNGVQPAGTPNEEMVHSASPPPLSYPSLTDTHMIE